MLGSTPDPRFHPKVVVLTATTVVLLATLFPVVVSASPSPRPISGYGVVGHH